jgi:hypothetical protein
MRTLLNLTIVFLLSHLSPTVNGQDSTGAVTFPRDRALSNFHFADPSDSTDFLRFIHSLRAEAGPTHADGAPKRYRQVWLVSEHGGCAAVSRGDGEVITLEAELPAETPFNIAHFYLLTQDGQTCIARFWDQPCALLCQTTTYYLEE